MTPLPPVSQIIRVNVGWTKGSDKGIESILHWQYNGGPPAGADCNTLANGIFSQFAEHITALLTESGAMTSVTVTDLSSDTGAQGAYIGSAAGSRTGSDVAAGTAVLVNHQIARRYRGGKPRTYFPLFTGSDLNTPQLWSTTAVGNLQTAWNTVQSNISELIAGSTSLTYQVNVSYFHAGIVRPAPLVDRILGSSVNQVVASQRRRNRPR